MTDRRHVLQVAALTAAGLIVLPACSDDVDNPPETSAPPDAEQAAELALIAAYDAALTQRDNETLRRIREEHAAHLRALGWQDPPPAATASTGPTRKELIRAERRAERQRATAAGTESDPDRAQVLALIAASEAQHVVTLGAL
jgi:hypothetical protein